MDKNNMPKIIGGVCLVIGILLLGRALSGGNPDAGKIGLPLILIVLGIISFTRKKL